MTTSPEGAKKIERIREKPSSSGQSYEHPVGRGREVSGGRRERRHYKGEWERKKRYKGKEKRKRNKGRANIMTAGGRSALLGWGGVGFCGGWGGCFSESQHQDFLGLGR